MAIVIDQDQLEKRYRKLALSVTMLHFNMPEFVSHMETVKERLLASRDKGDGVERKYFIHVEDNYFQYVIDYELYPYGNRLPVAIRLREVTVYDTFIEYEAARVKTLGLVKPNEQHGLNLN